jgi:hypothetical protein
MFNEKQFAQNIVFDLKKQNHIAVHYNVHLALISKRKLSNKNKSFLIFFNIFYPLIQKHLELNLIQT